MQFILFRVFCQDVPQIADQAVYGLGVCRGVELGQCVQFVETFDNVLSFRRAAGQDLTVIFRQPQCPNADSEMQNAGFGGCRMANAAHHAPFAGMQNAGFWGCRMAVLGLPLLPYGRE